MNLQGSGQRRLQRINVIGGRVMALGIERHTKAIVPENLDEIAPTTPEQIAGMWIALHRFLHL